MASRLSGIDSTDIERHQCHKALKKYRKQEFGGQKSAGLTPLNLSGSATPYWPLRGDNQKFGSDNGVRSQKLNFFLFKKATSNLV